MEDKMSEEMEKRLERLEHKINFIGDFVIAALCFGSFIWMIGILQKVPNPWNWILEIMCGVTITFLLAYLRRSFNKAR